jgi:uncharacterized protein (TIGR03435 family)
VSAYANAANQAFADRPITDATGVTGTFEWPLVFANESKANADLPSLFTAVQEQLGPKLDARTGPYEVLVNRLRGAANARLAPPNAI